MSFTLNKEGILLNFYYPWFICNSPFNLNEEAFILLHDREKCKSTPIEHFHSILRHKNQYDKEYTFIDFEVMGTNYDMWAEQIRNDLENMYINEHLQLIGGYSLKDSQNWFKLVMYKLSDAASLNFEFDIKADTISPDIDAEELEVYLNTKYTTHKWVFMSVLTVCKVSRSLLSEDKTEVLMHIVLFKDMSVNDPTYCEHFEYIIKQCPSIKVKDDREQGLLKVIEAEKENNNLEILGLLPGEDINNSMLIFARV